MKQLSYSFPSRKSGAYCGPSSGVVFLLCLAVSLILSSCSDKSPQPSGDLYEVNAPSQLILRSEPSKSGKKIVSLPHKSVIEVDFVENGWAHINWNNYTGYVSTDYLIPVSVQPAVEKSTDVSADTSNSNRKLEKLGYDYLPLLTLILFILSVVFLSQNENSMLSWWTLVASSVSEMVYLTCTSGFMYRFWFLEPSEVGWWWTIVCYALMLGLIVGQGIMIVIWVRSTSSGWLTGLLTWGCSFIAGLFFFMVLMTYAQVDAVQVVIALVFVAAMVGLVYYSNRNWSDVWYISLIDMIIIPAYLCMIIALLSHIILGIIGVIAVLIFSTKSSGKSKWFYVENEYGDKIRLRLSDHHPYQAYDSYGKLYEYFSDGKWRKT